jgi:hypothetical protein
MLFTGPAGLVESGRDRLFSRTSIRLPPGTWQVTAAVGASGTILLVSGADRKPVTVVVGSVVGARVGSRWVVELAAAAGPAVLPGCVSGDGRAVVIADGLVYLDAGRVVGTRDVPGTAGRCQMLDDGAVAYLAEADHALTVWRPASDAVVVTGTHCDDFAVGGGLLACLDSGGEVALGSLVPPVTRGPAFDERGLGHVTGPGRQVLLSPDGDWLAVVARDGPAVELYRLAGGRVIPAGASSLLSGEALLGFLGP